VKLQKVSIFARGEARLKKMRSGVGLRLSDWALHCQQKKQLKVVLESSVSRRSDKEGAGIRQPVRI
jgi:hypothetical protein